ncbi:MAG: hypothetical protein Phyf2KO_15620 [Phycisphaerales bacterium]
MRLYFIAVLALLCVRTLAQPGGDTERTPFTELRFDGKAPTIYVGDAWYVWHEIDGITYDELSSFALEIASDRWRERLSEDLVWLLREYGHEPGATVDLLVEPVEGGGTTLLRGVPMTYENRQSANRWADDNIELNKLIRARRARDGMFDRETAFKEIVQIVKAVHSYASLNDVDLDSLIEAELSLLDENADWNELLFAAQRIVCKLGDGHASVSGWRQAAPAGYMPALLQTAEGGIVAFKPDRSGFIDPECPYITEIDGLPIGEWIESASMYVTDGSEQLVRRRSLGVLRWINLIRSELGLAQDSHVTLTLTNGKGTDSRVKLEVTDQMPQFGQWPHGKTRVLDSGIGYMRLASMQPSMEFQMRVMRDGGSPKEIDAVWVDSTIREFESLAGCPSLIIDVRGNGGGIREPTLELMKRLMGAGSTPIVINAARARISRVQDPSESEGYLDNRMLYPQEWDGWNTAEREAIARFKQTFRPSWSPDAGSYSDWHYMVVTPDELSPPQTRPVVVLIDEGCFSATDIFAAALGELPNVTLVGQPTSGGSARSKKYDLENLGTAIRLGSMVSYQPNGKLYDGVGVTPDVIIERVPTDLIGETDVVLEAAERMLLYTPQ